MKGRNPPKPERNDRGREKKQRERKKNHLVAVFDFRGRWKLLGSRNQEAAVVEVVVVVVGEAGAGAGAVGACTDSS